VSARPEGGDEVYLGYTDFTTPPRVYRYRVAKGRLELWMDAPGQVDLLAGVTARQETYRSKDGTEVRLFLCTATGSLPTGPGRRSCTATAASTSR
jgi:prolyl oligopeptidase